MWKAPEHISVSEVDKCGSRRLLCCCGTHFNTNASNHKATLEWLVKHWNCDTESLTAIATANEEGMTIESGALEAIGNHMAEVRGRKFITWK